MRNHYLLAVVLLGALPAVAQTQSDSLAGRLSLKLAPLALLDPNYSTLQVGVDYRLDPRYSVWLSYGLQSSVVKLFQWHNDRPDLRYHKLRTGVRRYFRVARQLESYVEAEAFFIPVRYTISSYRTANGVHTFDATRARRDIWGGALNGGLLWHLGPRWQFDAAAGLGARHVETNYAVRNEQIVARGGFYEHFFEQSNAPGRSDWRPHLTFRLGIGYQLTGIR
ncbi:DUF3575 domain-containing protein [Hymenobacter sp. BT175]|uniref:DUF3575 domain-containing protein n=1 Tax=Hymenobacter translucens TaxID=2886507 RepID=UPI001D0E7097|nr:DUF3575 domain-containing protein [Hymenobacter translucens]MCC2548438.1 DUF3575 domain-containing protein [Hymenobacter translucens]